MDDMIEKRKVFLLNDEQKILVFFNTRRNYAPKIFIPNLYLNEEMNTISHPLNLHLDTLESYEFITEINIKMERLICENGHLKKGITILKNRYYAIHLPLTDEIRKNIFDICKKENLIADFLSIEEIEIALNYIYATNKNYQKNTKLENSLQVLKRKLNYEEY